MFLAIFLISLSKKYKVSLVINPNRIAIINPLPKNPENAAISDGNIDDAVELYDILFIY